MFSYKTVIRIVSIRLEYIAGKRAATAADYRRVSVCDADEPLLLNLHAAALTRLPAMPDGTPKDALDIALEATACYIIYSWLLLQGHPDATAWLTLADRALADLKGAITGTERRHAPLRPRPLPPM